MLGNPRFLGIPGAGPGCLCPGGQVGNWGTQATARTTGRDEPAAALQYLLETGNPGFDANAPSLSAVRQHRVPSASQYACLPWAHGPCALMAHKAGVQAQCFWQSLWAGRGRWVNAAPLPFQVAATHPATLRPPGSTPETGMKSDTGPRNARGCWPSSLAPLPEGVQGKQTSELPFSGKGH